MHALIISAIRLKYPEMASNEGAAEIASLSAEQNVRDKVCNSGSFEYS